jgi:hypothetical protein
MASPPEEAIVSGGAVEVLDQEEDSVHLAAAVVAAVGPLEGEVLAAAAPAVLGEINDLLVIFFPFYKENCSC